MVTRPSVASTAALMLLAVACGPTPASPPEYPGGVPIADRYGEVVGTADPEELFEVGVSIDRTEVHQDGELVGYFEEDGFIPLDDTAE